MLSTILTMPISIESIQLISPMAVESLAYSLPEVIANLQIDLHSFSHELVLAEQFQNVDILGNIQGGWTDFLHTGKAGAMAVGLVIGYMVRGMTS
jgi:hypothetical protein